MDAVCARFLPLLLIACHFHVHLDLVTPVPQGAHWLIRKQVRLADQARYHHALTVSSLGSDCQACTAPLLFMTNSIRS